MLGPYDLNQIYTGDARELARAIPDASVDLAIEDPPYGIGYVSSRTTRRNGQPRKSDNSFGEDLLDTSFITEIARILKPTGALYLFTRWDVLPAWKEAIEAARLKVIQRIVWDKIHWGMGDLRYYGNQLEDILFCTKSIHLLRWAKRQGNIWRQSNFYIAESQLDHPTQKPEAIISKMILNSSDPGDIVIDLHCGSGTTAACAKKLQRNFFCCDIQEKYADLARQRVAMTQPPLPMEIPVQSVLLEQ